MASRSPVSSGRKREEEEEGHDSYHGSREPDDYCVLPRDAILSFARDLILNHRMDEGRRLLPNFLADKQNPQMFMFKFTMLLFDCFQDNDFRSHYNKFLLPFFTKCIAFDIDRRELYLELISLMVRYGHFWESREFLADQSRKVSWTRRSSIVSMESLYKCYSSYLEYWSWHGTKHLADMKPKAVMIYSSVEKHLLNENRTCLDFMTVCVADMFKYYNDLDGAIGFFSDYAEKHDNNLSAQLQLFHFLQLQRIDDDARGQRIDDGARGQRIDDGARGQRIDDDAREQRIDDDARGQRIDDDARGQRIDDDAREAAHHSLRLKCYERISDLDAGHPVIASICSFIPETRQELLVSLSDSVRNLMSYLDYGTNKNDLNSWDVLVQHLKNLLKYNRKDFDEVKEHYIQNYHDHWQYYHFTSTDLEKGLERPKVLFCSMMDVCDQFVELDS